MFSTHTFWCEIISLQYFLFICFSQLGTKRRRNFITYANRVKFLMHIQEAAGCFQDQRFRKLPCSRVYSLCSNRFVRVSGAAGISTTRLHGNSPKFPSSSTPYHHSLLCFFSSPYSRSPFKKPRSLSSWKSYFPCFPNPNPLSK